MFRLSWTTALVGAEVMSSITNHLSRREGWFVRERLFWIDHGPRGRPAQHVPSADVTGDIRTVTYNVNGLSTKRHEVMHMLRTERIDVLLLQETRMADGDLVTFPGYHVFVSPMDASRPGIRGLLTAVRKTIPCHMLPLICPSVLAVQIHLRRDVPLLVCNEYIPVKSSGNSPEHRAALAAVRSTALAATCKQLAAWHRRNPAGHSIVAGDMNMPPAAMTAVLRLWALKRCPMLCRVPDTTLGDGREPPTHQAGGTIDHVIADDRSALGMRTTTLTGWDMSDHVPLMSVFPAAPAAVPTPEGFRAKRTCLRNDLTIKRIMKTNRFAALLQEATERNDSDNTDKGWNPENLCDAVGELQRGSQQLMRSVGAEQSACALPPSGNFLCRATKAAIDKRRHLAAKYRKLPHGADRVVITEQLNAARTVAKSAIKADLRSQRNRDIKRGAELAADGGKAKEFWRWCSTWSGRGRVSQSMKPVYSEQHDGAADPVLVIEPAAILSAWAGHFGDLCTDVGNHSRDKQYWADHVHSLPTKEYEGTNLPLGWMEFALAIKRAQLGKSAGVSGVPIELYKICLQHPPGYEGDPRKLPGGPSSDFADAVFQVARGLFSATEIPEDFNTSLLTPIPKKGDLQRMTNFRGICLIEVLLKIVTTVVTSRLSAQVESVPDLISEQAGFRPREECIAQHIALYDACRQRSLAGLDTWVGFLDQAKAFDRTEHEALFLKLGLLGTQPNVISFLRALYANPQIKVIIGGTRAPGRPWRRGVRQG